MHRKSINRLTTVLAQPATYLGLLTLAATFSTLVYLTHYHRAAAYNEAARHGSNLAQVVEEHVASTIRNSDNTLLFLRALYQNDPAQFDAGHWLNDPKLRNDSAFHITIVGADGLLRNSSAGSLDNPLDISQLEAFRVHVNSSVDNLFINKPLLLRATGKWSVQLTRRITAPDGSFAGIVAANIDPGKFIAKSLDLGNEGVASIAGFDGILRLRTHQGKVDSEFFGRSIAGADMFKRYHQAPEGTYWSEPNITDNVKRLISYRVVEGFPLIVVIGQAERDIYAESRYLLNLYYIIGAILAVVILVAIGISAVRQAAEARVIATNRELALRQYATDQSVIVAITDVKGRITYVNDIFCKISGYSREELIGQNHRMLKSDVHSWDFFRAMYRKIAHGEIWRGEVCNKAKDGSLYWVDTTIVSQLNDDGKPISYMAIRVDISARKAAEHALTESESLAKTKSDQLETVLTNVVHGVCMFDSDRRLIVCNRQYATMYGLSHDQTKPGTTLRAIRESRVANGSGPQDAERYIVERQEAFSEKPYHELQELRDGRIIAINHQPMQNGGWVAVHQDVSGQKRSEAKIAYLARHDSLTGLYNRIVFNETVERAFARARREGKQFGVFMLDLDRFKIVNDSLGHAYGDDLLKSVAQRLLACLRDTDLVARLGGDEFAILIDSVDDPREAAITLANRILTEIAVPYNLGVHEVVIGVSIGIALAPDHGADAAQLLKNADMAMYRAKEMGRNDYRFFEGDMKEAADERREVEIEIRNGLSRSEFELHYQPMVNVATRLPCGVEALVRWRHPQRGMLSPAAFIPIAEDTGLIVPLGEWILRKACADAANWPSHVKIAINLSAVQFRKGNLVEAVTNALADSRMPPDRLELEITESVLLQRSDENFAALLRLRGLGVSIALDDFGTGYSSLSYLRMFPFDKIKIDRSFVSDLAESDDCAAIVSAVVGMGRGLHIATVAEGVETEEQFLLVRAAGCTQAQGFLFGRPCAAAELVFDDPENMAAHRRPSVGLVA